MENNQIIKRKPGRPFSEKGPTKKFYCEYCCRSYKCNGPNDSHVRQHYDTNKCRLNRLKYNEKMNVSQTGCKHNITPNDASVRSAGSDSLKPEPITNHQGVGVCQCHLTSGAPVRLLMLVNPQNYLYHVAKKVQFITVQERP